MPNDYIDPRDLMRQIEELKRRREPARVKLDTGGGGGGFPTAFKKEEPSYEPTIGGGASLTEGRTIPDEFSYEPTIGGGASLTEGRTIPDEFGPPDTLGGGASLTEGRTIPDAYPDLGTFKSSYETPTPEEAQPFKDPGFTPGYAVPQDQSLQKLYAANAALQKLKDARTREERDIESSVNPTIGGGASLTEGRTIPNEFSYEPTIGGGAQTKVDQPVPEESFESSYSPPSVGGAGFESEPDLGPIEEKIPYTTKFEDLAADEAAYKETQKTIPAIADKAKPNAKVDKIVAGAAKDPQKSVQELLNIAIRDRDNEEAFATALQGLDMIGRAYGGSRQLKGDFYKPSGAGQKDVDYYRKLLEKSKGIGTKKYKPEQSTNYVDAKTGDPVTFDPNTNEYINNKTKKAVSVKVSKLRTSDTKKTEIEHRKIKDRKKLIETFRGRGPVKKIIAALDENKSAKAVLKRGNPVSYQLVRDMIIKSLGDSRISDLDVKRLGGSPALAHKAKQWLTEKLTGNLDETNKGFFLEMLNVIEKTQKEKYASKAKKFSKSYSKGAGKSYYGSEEDILDNIGLGDSSPDEEVTIVEISTGKLAKFKRNEIGDLDKTKYRIQ